MEIVKLFGGLLLVVCGTLAGLYASGKLRDRVKLLEQYAMFLNQAQSEIGYTASGIRELLTMPGTMPLLRPVFKDCLRLLNGGCQLENAWRTAVEVHIPDKNDRELLCYFGDHFGSSNISGELNKLSLHSELVWQRLDRLREEMKTKRRLYRVVGMFGGVVAAVLLI